MTPYDLAKSGSESAHQKAFFAYCAMVVNYGFEAADVWAEQGDWKSIEASPIPNLAWIFHVANGGSRGDNKKSQQIRGGNLKAEGVKEGVWDIFWPRPVFEKHDNHIIYCGLWIEMKKPSQKPKRSGSLGGLSSKQVEFGEYAYEQQYAVRVCYSWQEAVEDLKSYCKAIADGDVMR